MTTLSLLRYEWQFLSPKQTFELLVDVRRPIADRSFVYVAEALDADGQPAPDVSFSWFFSESMGRSFVYSSEVSEPSVQALRSLQANCPIHGLAVTVRPWGGAATREPHGDCWLRLAPTGSHVEPGVWSLCKARRVVEEITQ